MVEAREFLDKLWTKQWLAGKGFDVPRTLTLFRMQDFADVLTHVDSVRSYSKKFVVKPIDLRLSRGALILQKGDGGEWEYNEGCFAGAREINRLLLKAVKPGEETSLCYAEEYVASHAKFKWAQTLSSWGPAVCRFIIHQGKVTLVAVLCPRADTFGLAGAASMGWVAYAYLNREGYSLTPEEVAKAQGEKLTKKDADTLATKSYEVGDAVLGWEVIPEVIERIERILAPEVTPFKNKKGPIRPWSVDGVINTTGKFIVLECNHKPGHRFRVPI